MESEFFLNAGIITPVPPSLPLHFDPISADSPPMPAWRSLPHSSPAMDINNANSDQQQSPDCFFGNPNWERSTDHHSGALRYESALSSMVSSPVASNSNISTESFMIRELIGKLGNIGGSHNPGEISPHLAAAASSYGGSANNSCYSTPLSSPPKLSLPIMDQFVKTMGLNSSVAEFSADPGFAERAARFSCFGSRSFNGRTVQVSGGGGGLKGPPAMNGNIGGGGGKLPRVSSSPSLKALGSHKGNKGSPSPVQEVTQLGNSSASPEESSVSEQLIPNAGANGPNPRKRKAAPKGKARELSSAQPNGTTAKEGERDEKPNAKRSKGNGSDESKSPGKAVEEEAEAGNSGGGEEKQSKSKGNNNNNDSKPPEPPKDYIHVRARRGQATDSHSLAERVRREKISERMKLLQDLVPGCNKVTGKALMLDEIINYVQSLQRQVEFLSMKLASVDTRLDFNIDSLSCSKDQQQQQQQMYERNNNNNNNSSSGVPHAILVHGNGSGGSNCNSSRSSSSISNGTATHCCSALDPTLFSTQNLTLHCPLDPFSHPLTHHDQFQSFCDDDLQSLVQMGFAQNPINGPETDYSGSSPNQQASSHMKVEI